MSRYVNHFVAIAISVLLLAACSKKQAEELKPVVPVNPGTQVTYTGFVQGLLQSRCAGCHAPGRGGASAWSFNGYSSVTANADKIKQAVLVSKTMPLGGSLSAADLQSLQTWFDSGMSQ